MNLHWRFLIFALVGFGPFVHGAPADGLQSLDFTVDGIVRSAIVYVPPGARSDPLPVVFVFHGHGGTLRNAVGTFGINRLWPEAISVYPQGLNTPGKLTDPEGKRSGWQKSVGDQDDRDLHFFDAMLAQLKRDFPVDPKRIYCTGHSNGGGFKPTCSGWRDRRSSPPSHRAREPRRTQHKLTPKPAMILGGQNDPLVKFEWQELMMDAVRKINGCDPIGVPWG